MTELQRLYKQLEKIKVAIAAEKKRLRELNQDHIERVASETDFEGWRQADGIKRPDKATKELFWKGRGGK